MNAVSTHLERVLILALKIVKSRAGSSDQRKKTPIQGLEPTVSGKKALLING